MVLDQLFQTYLPKLSYQPPKPHTLTFTKPPKTMPPPPLKVRDSPSKKFKDPQEPTPEKGYPLRVFTGHPDFPAALDETRPRLIDVLHTMRIHEGTDCSKLRLIDAVVTVIFNFDPGLVERFFGESLSVPRYFKIEREGGGRERFDVVVMRHWEWCYVKLFEKTINSVGTPKRDTEPYIQATISFHTYTPPVGLTMALSKIEGRNWDHRLSIRTPQNKDLEDCGRRLARWLLLNRVWEAGNEGVSIKVFTAEPSTVKKSFRTEPDGEELVEVCLPAGGTARDLYENAGVNDEVEKDEYGFPSKYDDEEAKGAESMMVGWKEEEAGGGKGMELERYRETGGGGKCHEDSEEKWGKDWSEADKRKMLEARRKIKSKAKERKSG